jgi:hypothetical protein
MIPGREYSKKGLRDMSVEEAFGQANLFLG